MHDLGEKRGGFIATQAQLWLADLDHLSAHAQTSQRKTGVDATGEQEMQAGRKMIKQEL